MERAAQGPDSRRRTLLLLLLILLAGLAVRYIYLDSQLHARRFWDERFSFENVHELHRTGRLEPANGYYPLLSYLPQALLLSASDGLHRLTGADWLAVHYGESWTAHAYRLSRTVQALWGVAALWLTFLVGRRLFSPGVGLVAATAAAFSPWLVHASGVFKPDAPLLTMVLLAFYWGLAADRRPSLGGYAVAGAGVALAASMKLTGILVAAPLALVSFLRCRHEPRRLALLGLAGVAAAGLFLALNPHWPAYLEALDKLTHEYRWKASSEDMTRWQAPIRTGAVLLESLGWPTAAAAGVAAVVLIARLLRRRLGDSTWPGVVMLLFLPPAWVAGYMSRTEQFKSNNILPIVPLMAVVAAWGLLEAWRWLSPRVPRHRRRAVGALCLLLLALALVPRGLSYVYGSLTPSAEDLALRFADRRLRGRPICQLVHESAAAAWPPWERSRPFAGCHLRTVDRLTDLDLEELRLTDGVLFPQKRLDGIGATFYLGAVAAANPRNTAAWAPAAFRVRGPGAVVALHPWGLREPARTLALSTGRGGEFRLEAPMPSEVQPGETISFSLWLPRSALAEDLPPPRLKTGGKLVELRRAGGGRGGFLYVSPRLVNRQPGPRVRVNRRLLRRDGDEIELTLWRWRPE